MKLNYDRNSKDPTYFIQMGIRNGKKTTTKNIKRIGKHSELLAFTDDPLSYAKEQVAKFNEEHKKGKTELNIKLDFAQKLTYSGALVSKSTLSNIGYFFLQKIYQELGIRSFLTEIQSSTNLTFDCDMINRFLTFGRILDPRSKLGTYERLDAYYEKPQFEYQHILRFMDVLSGNYDAYLERLYYGSLNLMERNTSICYFDCTNYFFEIEQEDEEYVDEVTGEILNGLRRYGLSKQHQPAPLVQMGLFMDGDGIPISMCISPGSDNEQKCTIPLEKKISKMFKGRPFIYCADAGLGSYEIRKFNDMGGRAFIITQSVKKLSASLQRAVFNDFDYRRLSDDTPMSINDMKRFDRFLPENISLYNDCIYKVIHTDTPVDTGLYEDVFFQNGRSRKVKAKGMLHQRIIITFSRKMMEYQRRIRNAQIERAMRIMQSGKTGDTKKGPNDVRRFIKRISVGPNGEKANERYEIDRDMIEKEEKYDGFYAVATNLQDDAKSILAVNSRRYKIEDCFRVLKTNFEARPVHHRIPDRIIAHFMICYTALLIYRILECKLDRHGTHFTTENILETLKNMNLANLQDLCYSSTYTESQVCTALNTVFPLGLDKQFYEPKELNKLIKKISK